MYGKVSGPMTEETPFNPCSKKGEIRAKIATALINEWESGCLVAMLARSVLELTPRGMGPEDLAMTDRPTLRPV